MSFETKLYCELKSGNFLFTKNNVVFKMSIDTFLVVIDCLGIGIVPYVALLVLPVLGRMSDQNDSVRLMATSCFASLVRLMPLDVSAPVTELENSNRNARGSAISVGGACRRAW